MSIRGCKQLNAAGKRDWKRRIARFRLAQSSCRTQKDESKGIERESSDMQGYLPCMSARSSTPSKGSISFTARRAPSRSQYAVFVPVRPIFAAHQL